MIPARRDMEIWLYLINLYGAIKSECYIFSPFEAKIKN